VFGDRLLVKPSVSDAALAERVERLAPDLLVSWFWTTRLPMRFVRAARLRGIGVHPSLLPRHRGPDPTFWAIASGDTETGVTAHRIEEAYDTGAILGAEHLAIDPDWNAWQLARALDRPSLRLLRATVARFARGEHVDEIEQDPALATEAPAPDDEAAAIRWAWPTERVLRHIRALAPAPGAWTEVAGRPLVVLRAERALTFPPGLTPGEGVEVDGRVIVGTGDGAVTLLEGEALGVSLRGEDLVRLFSRAPKRKRTKRADAR
jgi:methionyl-tRNA formyltransferase